MYKVSQKRRRGGMRIAIAWVCLAILFVFGLSYYKESKLSDLVQVDLGNLTVMHPELRNLFQASFYFFYKDQFLPETKKKIEEVNALTAIQFINTSGIVLYDSKKPPADPSEKGELFPRESVRKKLESEKHSIFISGFTVQILMPSGQYSVLYTFDHSSLRGEILKILLTGVVAAILLSLIFLQLGRMREKFKLHKLIGLRAKFLATIVLINLITGGIIYYNLSELQIKEQTESIQKDSILFSQVATDKVISDFADYYTFYYRDKFLPSIKSIIAKHEDLYRIRIVSYRHKMIVFDSEKEASGPVVTQRSKEKIEYDRETEAALRTRGTVSREVIEPEGKYLEVINSFFNESQDLDFFVEYRFSYYTPERSVARIREQIVLDLIPSMAIGLLIAGIFAQLLISPVRKLVNGLRKVTEGDFEVKIDIERSDEIGQLVDAFNSMTNELRKKTELRKYLSDSNYRQVMESHEKGESDRLVGTRVNATILFCDIRNFVGHCEALDAEEVTNMLNEYFSEMVDVIYRNGGEVDKFIGDGLLAVFYSGATGNEVDQSVAGVETSLNAIYCALEMRERLAQFNDKRVSSSKESIEIGVGISYGEIISGPIGARDRMDFTVIGDVVNLAARIEKMSKKGKHTKVVFSSDVEERIRGLLEYEKLEETEVRGLSEKVSIFELVKIRNLEDIVKLLGSEDLGLKARSLELLGRSRNQKAVPPILEALNDLHAEIRLCAVTAVTRFADSRDDVILDALFLQLYRESSEKVISALITSIGKICTTERILELAPFLASKNERIVANAVEAMGTLKSPACSDLILPKLSSRNNRIKANAAMALFAAGNVLVIDSLKPMLMHSDPLMRSSAAFAIGELTLLAHKDQLLEDWKRRGSEIKLFLGELQECVPMLVSLLKDAEPMVKRQAIIALGKIKDKSAVLPIIDNVNLESDSKEMVRDIAHALRSIGSHKLVREVLSRLE